MNLIGIKELISYNYHNISFVEKPSANELVIKKDLKKGSILLTITQNVIKNQFTITFPGGVTTCYNVSSLIDFIELIN